MIPFHFGKVPYLAGFRSLVAASGAAFVAEASTPSANRSSGPSLMITDRSSTFISSRTFPGHGYASSAAIVRLGMREIRLPWLLLNRVTK